MIYDVVVKLDPSLLHQKAELERKLSQAAGIKRQLINDFEILKRSIDARRKPVYRLKVRIYTESDRPTPIPTLKHRYRHVDQAPEVLIIGAGPAGYFAALECLEMGLKPVVIDRGKDVRSRRRDLRNIQQFGKVDPDSNYCFGEGGAGTYSDGKLYTRSRKKGNVGKVLQILVEHGAKKDILIDAHPHIGSNKLPGVIENIRETIETFGGIVQFNSRMTDFMLEDDHVRGVRLAGGRVIHASSIVLCTGHSARDIYDLFLKYDWILEPKPFALGLRIEHPQALIDRIQYGQTPRAENLPAATYRVATEIGGSGVYSFCMCPGGLIVPAATAPGELVVNGMSMSRRDSRFANAGLVVSIAPDDWQQWGYEGMLGGIDFQREVEQSMHGFSHGMEAPAQRLLDFMSGKVSRDLPESSYIPGLVSAPLHSMLPGGIYEKMVAGLKVFGGKMKGYLTNEAVVVGVESRTSSPVRIPRSEDTGMHPQVKGLFPCGEGAGYAGGIMSAAIDGQRVISYVAQKIFHRSEI